MKRISLCCFMFLSMCGCNNIIYADAPQATQTLDNSYVTDLNIALKLSRETKQNIVLIFSASWCGHCRNLKSDLPNIKEFDNKIICILDSDVEKKLARKFKAKSLPTSIILNSNGEEVSRIVGYDKESYVKWLGK